jgi:hypothetical protein
MIAALSVAVCLTSLWAVPAQATQREVGSGQTYTTIQACINAMAAGDVCNVHAGTYTEQLTLSSGTSGNLKTIQRNGSDSVIVTSTSSPVVSSSNNDYWKLDGLDIRYTGSGANPSVILDTYDGSSSAVNGWTITNCILTLGGTPSGDGFIVYIADAGNATFSNNVTSVTATSGTHDGWEFLDATNLTISGNTLSGIASTSGTLEDGLVTSGANLTITNNTLSDGWSYDNHPDAIVVQGTDYGSSTNGVVISNNTIKNFTQGIYIDCFSADCLNISIYNNVVYEQDPFQYGGSTTTMNCLVIDSENVGTITAVVYNNTFDCQQLSVYYLRAKAANTLTIKNNIITLSISSLESTGTVTMDYNYYVYAACGSKILDYGGANYSFTGFQGIGKEANGLCTTSATLSMPSTYIPDSDANSIGRGTDLSGVFTTDRAGTTRAAPWDIGAYEYVSGAAVASPPPTTGALTILLLR